MELVTASPAETEALAARLAARLAVGDVVAVSGELGAGKTTFAVAQPATRVTGTVSSPNFRIGHRYEAKTPVAHLDLYRITGLDAEEWGTWSRTSTAPSPLSNGRNRRELAPPMCHGYACPRRRIAPPRSDLE